MQIWVTRGFSCSKFIHNFFSCVLLLCYVLLSFVNKGIFFLSSSSFFMPHQRKFSLYLFFGKKHPQKKKVSQEKLFYFFFFSSISFALCRFCLCWKKEHTHLFSSPWNLLSLLSQCLFISLIQIPTLWKDILILLSTRTCMDVK